MAEPEPYAYTAEPPPIFGAISSEPIIREGMSYARRLSHQDQPHYSVGVANPEPLKFGNISNNPSLLLKKYSMEAVLPPKPGNKTPKEKQRICFGTPLQRSDSRQSLERPVSRTEKQPKFKNQSAKKPTNFHFEQPPANFQFSKRLSRKSSNKRSAGQADNASQRGANGKQNEPNYEGKTLLNLTTNPYFGDRPFQDLSNRKIEVFEKTPSEYFTKEAVTTPFVLEQQRPLGERRIISSDSPQQTTGKVTLDVSSFLSLSQAQTLTTSIILDPVTIEASFNETSTGLPSNLSLDQFIKGKRLGKGHFGEVFVVKHKQTGFVCALKTISKEHIANEKVTDQIVRELKIHSTIKHPNIIALYGFFFDEKNLYILQQLCTDGQLYDLLKKKRRISEKYTAYIIKQLLEGLRYLHMNSIFHRDIKPENILMENGIVKICDFGWAVHCIGMRSTRCGTPLYLSPEIVRGEAYDEKIDIWAVGVMTYELITGSIPFHIWCEEDVKKIVHQHLSQAEDEVKFPPYIDMSDHAKDFILKSLNKDPAARIGLLDLYYHPFLSNSNEMQFVPESEQCSD